MKAYKSKVIVVGGRWLARVLLLLSMATFGLRVCARAILVPTQPVSPYADTEVSTNVVIQAGRTDVRDVKIRLQLDGTPTNNLEIAFGCDVENARAWERIEAEAAVNALCGVLDVHLEHGPDFAPRRFTATCGGETAFSGLSTTLPPAWLFRNGWNMARIVRRGAGTPSEWVRCDVRHNSFALKVR